MATYYRQRANPVTGAGLIITEATAISHQAQGYADVPGIWQDSQVAAWRVITEAVHAEGGKIVMQLWHVGRVAHCSLQPGGGKPVSASALAAKTKTYIIEGGVGRFVDTQEPRALEASELPAIVQDYAHAARNAMAAGFDGVEVHAANGYLIEQFLKTSANQRTDDWGGSIENRARLLLAVMAAVVAAVGGERTALRLSPVTPANDILDADPQPLYAYLARQLAPLGLAYLHLVEGSTGGPRELPERPFDYAAFKAAYRAAGGQAAWMLNNGYDAGLAQAALAQGADLIAFGRPFIANPDLTRRLREAAPQNSPDRKTFYGGTEVGYTDYPALG
jgi:N-ethylmaleimide reductase